MKVNIVNKSNNPLPEYKTLGSAGMDIRANIVDDNPKKDSIVIRPGGTRLIPTGLFLDIPEGYEVQIRPRSGLALKKQVTVLNSPGTVDSDYRGEIGVILTNFGDVNFIVNHGDRIAQMIITKHERAEFNLVDSLEDTERGEGGFGHTGVK